MKLQNKQFRQILLIFTVLGKMTHMCVFATLLMYFLLNGASVTVYLFLLVVILVSL